MDNAEGRKNEEAHSGARKFQDNHDQRMECADDAAYNSYHTVLFSEPRIQISPQSLGSPQALISNSQVCCSISLFVCFLSSISMN